MKIENIDQAVKLKNELNSVNERIDILTRKNEDGKYECRDLSICLGCYVSDLFNAEEMRQRAIAILNIKKAELEKEISELE